MEKYKYFKFVPYVPILLFKKYLTCNNNTNF